MKVRVFSRCVALGISGMLVAATPALALKVRLDEDRISLRADRDTLRDVLKEFARAGVYVQMDPRIDARVSGTLIDEPLQRALDKLLSPFGYVLFWQSIDGPVGPLIKLSEIRVFKPGEEQRVSPLPEMSDNLDVTTGPSGGPAFVRDEVLIGCRPGTTYEAFKRLIDQLGGTVVQSIPSLGIYRIRLPAGSNVPALVDQLAGYPIVARVEPNYVAQLPDMPPAQAAAGSAAWPAGSPQGLPSLAILDSGLMPSDGLNEWVVGRYDALNPDRPLNDTLGHGTQMAMIGAGAVQPGGVEEGPNAGVPIVAIRAFDDNGNASSFSLMNSIDYAVQQGARVINLSWGTYTDSAFIRSAVDYAQSKGLTVVAATGNEPSGQPMYPAALPGVVGVSALNADGSVWESANTGAFVDLAAPGAASFPVGYEGPPGAYAGTSIASAYAARALALYYARHPNATQEQALTALASSLTDAGAEGRDAQYGLGMLDADAMNRLLGGPSDGAP